MKSSTIIFCLSGCLLLAGILIPTGAVCGFRSKEASSTEQLMNEVAVALQLYYVEYDSFPENNAFQKLSDQNPKGFKFMSEDQKYVDWWSNPLLWRGPPFLELRSSGPDGVTYSKDDIIRKVHVPSVLRKTNKIH